jgi:hypothetical protein
MGCLLLVGVTALPGRAWAFEGFTNSVPCANDCTTCHTDDGAGCGDPPCLDAFGAAFSRSGARWSAELAAMDSDGDGVTNGHELADPSGEWIGAAFLLRARAFRPTRTSRAGRDAA